MHPAYGSQALDPNLRRVLSVSDWKVDPRAVADAFNRQHNPRPESVALMGPARLHGVDWLLPSRRASLLPAEEVTGAETANGHARVEGAGPFLEVMGALVEGAPGVFHRSRTARVSVL